LDGGFDVGFGPLFAAFCWAACCCILQEQVEGGVVAGGVVWAHSPFEWWVLTLLVGEVVRVGFGCVAVW